jgi:outer membrane protein assembly factor BamB
VYVGSTDHKLYALNATTGAVLCSFNTGNEIASSPVVADPDGHGKLVFVGDNGLSGADDGGHFWAINAVDPNAAADCSQRWMFSGFGEPPGSQTLAGSWSPPAVASDVNGRAMVFFGGSSPDNAVYALDATSGQRVWRFQTVVTGKDQDVGAGPTVSPPGVNGLVDGAVYVAGKDNIMYALNLRTGAKLWDFKVGQDASFAPGSTRSTAALLGNRLLFGFGAGLYSLDAVTGAKVWRSDTVNGATIAQVVSSPAVAGPAGNRVVFAGDMGGAFRAFNAATGVQLWSYNVGGFIYASPAVSDGQVYIASSTGFVSAFGLGGGASDQPTTGISYPAEGAQLVNAGGTITVTGTAADDVGVTKVLVAIRNRNTGGWWNAATGRWIGVFTSNPASLGAPGSSSTSWSLPFPVGMSGGLFYAQAEAVDGDSQHDPTVAARRFQVNSLGDPPDTAITEPPSNLYIYHFAQSGRASFPVTIRGTASDSGGPHPGIKKVNIVIQNLGHHEYYCGSPGCAGSGGTENTAWTPVFTVLTATVASPGALSTTWSFTVPVYDHPHKYQINAWATDLDNEADQTRAARTFCTRDYGDNLCR